MSNTVTMNPLTVPHYTTLVVYVSKIVHGALSEIQDAPESISILLAEVVHIEANFTVLADSLDTLNDVAPEQTAPILMENLEHILTETVIIFSELQPFVQSLSCPGGLSSWKQMKWPWQQSVIDRAIKQLQRQKGALSALLKKPQCGTDIEQERCTSISQEHGTSQGTNSGDLISDLHMSENEDITDAGSFFHDGELGRFWALANNSTASTTLGNRDLDSTAAEGPPNSSGSVPLRTISVTSLFEILVPGANDPLALQSSLASRSVTARPGVCDTYCTQCHDRTAALEGGALKRTRKEAAYIASNPIAVGSIGPVGENLAYWQGVVYGPPNSPYADGVFYLKMHIPKNYPYEPPHIRFTTRIYHPSIGSDGTIALWILRTNWAPGLTIEKVLLSISSLLANQERDEPLVPEIEEVYTTNRLQYEETARFWTKKYAM